MSKVVAAAALEDEFGEGEYEHEFVEEYLDDLSDLEDGDEGISKKTDRDDDDEEGDDEDRPKKRKKREHKGRKAKVEIEYENEMEDQPEEMMTNW